MQGGGTVTKFISLTQVEMDMPIHAVSVNPQQIASMESAIPRGTWVSMSNGEVLTVVQERDEIIETIQNINSIEAHP